MTGAQVADKRDYPRDDRDEEVEDVAMNDGFKEDVHPYIMGDRIIFTYGEEIMAGVVRGLAWNAGNINDPDRLPTPISEPADNLLVKIEGEKNLQVISVKKVIRKSLYNE